MAEPIDTAPTTSYSDPIYDRLELASQAVRRRWYLVVLALLLCLAVGLVLRWYVSRNPDAASAVAFVQAQSEDEAKRDAALRAVAADAAITPGFRARAWQEVAQSALFEGKPDAARDAVAKAAEQAALSQSDELVLAVRLTQAAVAEDAGQLDDALGHYEAVQGRAQKFPAQLVPAVLGKGRVLAAQGKPAEAITALEDVISRTDDGVEGLVAFARTLYWRCKRDLEGAPASVPKIEDPNKPAAAMPVQPSGEATPAAEAPKAEISAPSAPAADAAAAPATPAPVPAAAPAPAK